MILKIIGPIVTCLMACFTFWAAILIANIAFNDWGSLNAWGLVYGSGVLFAIGALIIGGGYIALKPNTLGRSYADTAQTPTAEEIAEVILKTQAKPTDAP